MKITRILATDISIPLKRAFKTAVRSAGHVCSVIARIEAEGLIGFGEAAETPAITGETIGGIRHAISNFIAPAIIGRDLSDFEELMSALKSSINENPSAKACVDMALYSLRAQSLSMPLWRLLGGARRRIETDITVSMDSPERMADSGRIAVSEGYRILKLKVGSPGDLDVKRVAQVREAVGDAVAIRVDANQGWSAKQAVRIIRTLEDMGLNPEIIEQPTLAGDIDSLAFVNQNVHTPILADESVRSSRDASEILFRRAADCVNVKLMKCGGIHEALKIIAACEAFGADVMMGSMLEGGLASSAAAHLACGALAVSMADLDSRALVAEDPFEGGPIFSGGDITMSDTYGIGVLPKGSLMWE